ncbi:MAG: HEAT repeat domain-containing protein [bacterium]
MSSLPEATRRTLLQCTLGDQAARASVSTKLAELVEAGEATAVDAELATALIALFPQYGRTDQRRLADALQPLAQQNTAVRGALEAALGADDASLRWGAAFTLGHAFGPSPSIAVTILQVLGDENGDSRWAAAELACGLARISEDFAGELRAATRAETATLRRMALYCLRDLKVPDLMELARERLNDTAAHGRLAALSALAVAAPDPIARDRLVTPIGRLVQNDPDPGVRRAAAAVLGRLGAPAARRVLEQASAADDPSLARAAANALAKLPPSG